MKHYIDDSGFSLWIALLFILFVELSFLGKGDNLYVLSIVIGDRKGIKSNEMRRSSRQSLNGLNQVIHFYKNILT